MAMYEPNFLLDDYGASRSQEPVSDEFKSDYWDHVKVALREVFAADEALAAPLREIIDRTTAELQTAFYDVEPFAVAVDLSKALYRCQ
jgi:hypothetical protein